MSIYNLDRIFRATSVAVVGASEKKGSIGHSLIQNLIGGGYEGKIFPVNPSYDTIQGLPAYRSISKIKGPVDLVVIATPIATVPGVIKDCVKADAGGAVVISAGGKEIGAKGRQIEAEIQKEATKGGLRIIGPNCMGMISAECKLNASFARSMPLSGKLAFVSQSGAICATILDLSEREGIGFRHFVSIGSMLDVDFGDLINYLGTDPHVSSIVLYIESLTEIRKFMSAARAVSRVKPIVVLKAGRSEAGARAASSHTGALAGEDAVYDAAFKRAGIVRVSTIEELFDCAELMAKQPIPSGLGLAIMTNGGGPGVMATDALAAHGVEPVSLRPDTIKRLNELLPAYWSRGNPIDILGDASPKRWQQALEVCLSATEINASIVIFVPQALSNSLAVAEAVVELLGRKDFPPIFAVWMGGDGVAEGIRILNEAGVPTYETPERAVSAFMYMHSYARNIEMLQEIPPKLPADFEFDHATVRRIVDEALARGNPFLTEVESKALLEAYGIPTNQTMAATSAEEAVRLARKIGYPVVMKVLSRDIIHKTDAKCVKLGLRNEVDVSGAFTEIVANAQAFDSTAEIMGVSVQPMLTRSDYEIFLGSKQHAGFGPAIVFGMGGIMTEILMDRAVALPPLNLLLARRLIEGTRVHQMLRGYRNRPAVRLDRLEEVLVRFSQLVTDFSEIAELDINPIILGKDLICAVDGRVIIRPTSITAPHHLVISPYPNQYEIPATTRDGLSILVRPIKPEDAPLLVELFHTLSQRSVYHRFFTPLKSLSPRMLALFTQIDYDRDIALVAIDKGQSKDRMLGVARLMRDPPGGSRGEFAVTVGDPWQGEGVGAILLERLIEIAAERGFDSIWGLVLAENRNMRSLARKLGFSISSVPVQGQYELELDLKARGLKQQG